MKLYQNHLLYVVVMNYFIMTLLIFIKKVKIVNYIVLKMVSIQNILYLVFFILQKLKKFQIKLLILLQIKITKYQIFPLSNL